jgi:RNA polymerase sigma-70 factor (ECF subfamily)
MGGVQTTACVGDARVSGESAVSRALARLSPRDQEVLLMVAWDGLAREQAAAVLGITSGAFAVRLYRARGRFTRALAIEDRRQVTQAERSPAMKEASR